MIIKEVISDVISPVVSNAMGGLPQTRQALRFNAVNTFGRLAVTLFIISVIEHNSYDNN